MDRKNCETIVQSKNTLDRPQYQGRDRVPLYPIQLFSCITMTTGHIVLNLNLSQLDLEGKQLQKICDKIAEELAEAKFHTILGKEIKIEVEKTWCEKRVDNSSFTYNSDENKWEKNKD